LKRISKEEEAEGKLSRRACDEFQAVAAEDGSHGIGDVRKECPRSRARCRANSQSISLGLSSSSSSRLNGT
jgi:hypothetical protein